MGNFYIKIEKWASKVGKLFKHELHMCLVELQNSNFLYGKTLCLGTSCLENAV